MTDKIEKARFHLEAEEYDKAEKLFSEIFDQNGKNAEALIGLNWLLYLALETLSFSNIA